MVSPEAREWRHLPVPCADGTHDADGCQQCGPFDMTWPCDAERLREWLVVIRYETLSVLADEREDGTPLHEMAERIDAMARAALAATPVPDTGAEERLRAGHWTTERRPEDDAECERLGCEDRTHPVHHWVPDTGAEERLRAALVHYVTRRHVFSMLCDRCKDVQTLVNEALSGGSIDEEVCTCGPWQIGQPEGHLAGCPRAVILSGGSIDEEAL